MKSFNKKKSYLTFLIKSYFYEVPIKWDMIKVLLYLKSKNITKSLSTKQPPKLAFHTSATPKQKNPIYMDAQSTSHWNKPCICCTSDALIQTHHFKIILESAPPSKFEVKTAFLTATNRFLSLPFANQYSHVSSRCNQDEWVPSNKSKESQMIP